MLHAVIMAGGSGTRFWPQSRSHLPKQLLRLAGERTMIQQTLDRCGTLVTGSTSWVVTNRTQAKLTREQLPQVPADQVLCEPAARNTAPCVGLAAVHLLARDPEAVMLVMPADHVIASDESFQQAIGSAATLLEEDPDRLVLFGVRPDHPATGYGYIEQGDPLGVPGSARVSSFREKPDESTAAQYVSDGKFLWNCGIFCWKASRILELLKEHCPDMHNSLLRIADAVGTDAEEAVLEKEFPEMQSISVDYAVLEKAGSVCVIEAPFTWDDVGSWPAVARLLGSDDSGNTLDGPACVIESENCIVRTSDDHLVALLGVEDLIVVHTEDATLVARRDHSERVREILDSLRKDNRDRWL